MNPPVFPAPFLDALDRATLARNGRPGRDEVRFRCPADGHPDEHPSARWNRAKAVWHCDACGAGGGALDLADRLGVEKPRSTTPPLPPRSPREGVKSAQPSQESASLGGDDGEGDVIGAGGITLAQLAEAKQLPLDFLRSLGLRDKKLHGAPTVVVPYLDMDGEEAGIRYRHRLDPNGKRFSWRTGDRVMLYGLHRLGEIRTGGWVLIVEGESDCWTCWRHGVPALGVPGKTHWKQEWRFLLNGLTVFVWREPGAQDFVDRVAKDLADVQVMTAPDGTKDLSEAHCRGENVAQLVERLKAAAVPAKALTAAHVSGARGRLLGLCSAVLEAADPLALIEGEIKRVGYGGEISPALISYLSVTTRLLAMRRGAMPGHLLLLGSPSAGKSYTLAIVLSLLPEDAYHVIDAGSPRALIYDSAELRHRVLIFAEADSLPAGEDNPAASAVRNLLQDHRLHYQVTERDPETGQFVTREISKPGPTLLVTTAVKSLGSQMMTRVFALPVPEDVKRLQQALATQATIELDGAAEPNGALIAFQGYLQTLAPWDVVVPFVRELSDAIAATANASRILRDFQRLLSLIKAVTIVRHTHRRQNAAGRWMATIDDYATVYRLVGPMFEASVSGSTEMIRMVVAAVADLSKGGSLTDRVKGGPITYSAVARAVGIHPQQAKRAVLAAIEHEWLINDEDKANKAAKLRIGEPMPETAGLPAPEQVAAAFTGSSRRSRDQHAENPDGSTGFTVSQPDRPEHAGVVLDGREAPPSPNGASGEGPHVRVCVERGASLPLGWRGFSCAEHGGGPAEAAPATPSRRSRCETVNPFDDPRYADTVANHAALDDGAFAELGEELRWLDANQPGAADLALDVTAYAEASRLRQARTGRGGGDLSPAT